MGTGYFTSPLMLIIETLFDLYILMVLLRFLLQMLRADFYNPVSQFIVRVTTPPLRILRRIIPSVAGQDSAAIVLCLLLLYAKYMLLRLVSVAAVTIAGAGAMIGGISYAGLVVICIADLVSLTFNVFLIAIFLQVILSWINPGHYNPAIGLINRIAEPVLRPFRSLIPSIGGMDISPIFAILGLTVAKMLVVPPIVMLGHF